MVSRGEMEQVLNLSNNPQLLCHPNLLDCEKYKLHFVENFFYTLHKFIKDLLSQNDYHKQAYEKVKTSQ